MKVRCRRHMPCSGHTTNGGPCDACGTPAWTPRVVPYLGRVVDRREHVEVYRNLNRPGVVYSVRQHGRVVGHTPMIDLTSVQFVVEQAGRRRVIATGRKNVHAYVCGIVTELGFFEPGYRARYNPYGCNAFFDATTGRGIRSATAARLDAGGIHYVPFRIQNTTPKV